MAKANSAIRRGWRAPPRRSAATRASVFWYGLALTQEPIEIGGVEIPPGGRETVQLSVPRLYNRAELSIPVRVIHGRKPGPRLLLCGTIHGNEVNGIETIQRVLNLRGYRSMAGTLIAAPVLYFVMFRGAERKANAGWAVAA